MSIPSNYQETLAQQVRWAARNIVYNLDFLPADKLEWKPTPDAPSALEIVNHIGSGMLHMQIVLRGGEWSEAEFTPTSSLEGAKAQLIQISGEFAATLETIRRDQMDRIVETPFGTFSVGELMRFEPTDIVHHHGQIAYIQQLLGDKESHFDPTAL